MKPYERLLAWQLCHELALTIYKVTLRWPDRERYGMISQIRRAAVSAPNNIAEGYAKRGPGELRKYLDTSLGSLSEIGYLLRLARDLGIMGSDEWRVVERRRDAAARMTWKLYKALKV